MTLRAACAASGCRGCCKPGRASRLGSLEFACVQAVQQAEPHLGKNGRVVSAIARVMLALGSLLWIPMRGGGGECRGPASCISFPACSSSARCHRRFAQPPGTAALLALEPGGSAACGFSGMLLSNQCLSGPTLLRAWADCARFACGRGSRAMADSRPGTLRSTAAGRTTGGARRTDRKAFSGKLQPVYSRAPDSGVWTAAVSRPGPGQYTAQSSVGRQADSRKASSTATSFGKAPRTHTSLVSSVPGPKYDVPSSVGKQACSKRPTAPSSSFGTSTRTAAALVYSSESSKLR